MKCENSSLPLSNRHPFWIWLGRGVLLLLFIVMMWLHCASKISLITADLGRHIRNGELFVQSRQIITTNFYAYTYPDFPTICHHWGAGVLFYFMHQFGGFDALSVLYTVILVITGMLFAGVAWRLAGFWVSLLAGVLVLPLIGYRVEIRPEGFTTLFLGLEFMILMFCRFRLLSARWLWVIPLIQVIWINTHILFFTGFVLGAFFLLDAFLNDADRRYWKKIAWVGGVSAGASWLNPFGMEGVMEPLNIFRAYGYQLAENQNVFFMMKRFSGNPIYPYFLLLLVISVVLFGVRCAMERRWRQAVLEGLLLCFFGVMAMNAVRAVAMFGFFLIPLLALQLRYILLATILCWRIWAERMLKWLAIVLVLAAALNPSFFLSPVRRAKIFLAALPAPYQRSLLTALAHPVVWSGLAPDVNGSAEFIKANGLKGPVFNNYDIGGYMIYHLFPQEKPFVDNRPEAYPDEFFRQIYGPMQEDDVIWKEVDRRYGFQMIYFYRHDQTTWAQPFLLRRVADSGWAPVFVDAYAIILVKRGGINQRVIERFELPQEMFRAK